jgi:hypothetical protein
LGGAGPVTSQAQSKNARNHDGENQTEATETSDAPR